MNKSKIKEIKVFYSAKNKNKQSSTIIPEIKSGDFGTDAMSFFNSVIKKLKINKNK